MALLPLVAVVMLTPKCSYREVTFFEDPEFPLTHPWTYKLFLLLL